MTSRTWTIFCFTSAVIFKPRSLKIFIKSFRALSASLPLVVFKIAKPMGSNKVNNITEDTKTIADSLDITDWMTTMAKNEAFITNKVHKSNFENNPKCRLINPAKSELGRISKAYLDEINTKIRTLTRVNQWRNTSTVIDWFKNITDKCKHTFLTFDIVDFYPSISKDLLKKAPTWASWITKTSIQHTEVIMHARKFLLFSNERPWVKKDSSPTFDVSMGSFNGAKICKLVGLFILSNLEKRFRRHKIVLYRDDGLAILKTTSGRLADRARKDLIKIFNDLGLKFTAEVNQKIVHFLDATFDLTTSKYYPYRKPNDDPLYINSRSNHPPSRCQHFSINFNRNTVKTRNTCTQQPLAHPSNRSLENPSNIDNFSKLSKRQILHTITGRGYAV